MRFCIPPSSDWKCVGFAPGSGTSVVLHEYTFVDRGLQFGWYDYRIKQIDRNGASKYRGEAQVVVGSAPKELTLGQNYPHQFNPTMAIEFTLERSGRAVLKAYNILGQKVAMLYEQEAVAGRVYQAQFSASRLTPGVYLSTLESGGKRLYQTMLQVK